MAAKKESNRLAEIDSLRGFAALGVMFYHFIYRYPGRALPRLESIVNFFGIFPVKEYFLGALPVYLFFTISGFVILVTATRCSSAAEFLYRRFSRLYPVYWAAIGVMLLTLWIFQHIEKVSLLQVLTNLTMLQEYFGIPHISGVFWSLTVELSFYAMVAVAIGAGLMPYRKYLLLAWSVLIFLYGFFPAPNPIPWPFVWILALDYGHFFLAGIVFFEIWSNKQAGINKLDKLYWIMLIISLASSFIRYPLIVCFIILAFYAVFYMAVMEKAPFLKNRWPIYFGSISYALYLSHELIGFTIMERLQFSRLGSIISATLICLVIADLLTRWVERPSMEWLRVRRPSWAR